MYAAGAAVAAVVVWMFIPQGLIGGKTDAGKTVNGKPVPGGKKNPSAALNGLQEQPGDLFLQGAVARYRAGLKMEPWLETKIGRAHV